MKRTALATFVLALAILTPRSAWAFDHKGTGNLGGNGNLTVGTQVQIPGSDAPVDVNGGGHTQPPIFWTTIDTNGDDPGDISRLCNADPSAPQPVYGVNFLQVAYDSNGKLLDTRVICLPIVDGHPPAPPPPPVLPTLEEVWRSAQLPTPLIGIDPAKRGITGLDTRIWTETGNTVTITASLDGYSVSGTATVVGYLVQVDDGATTKTDTAGGPDNPIAHHLFETKGDHKVSIGVIWHGVATFDGPDLVHPLTVGIGDATITATLTYPVSEVRSVLQP